MRNKKTKRKKSVIPVVLFVIVLLVMVAASYSEIRRFFVSMMITTVPAEPSILEDKISGEGLVFLKERTISAKFSGKIKFLKKNNQRVRQGECFAQLSAFGTTSNGKSIIDNISAPQAGLLLYWWDGLENVINIDSLGNSKADKLFEITNPKSPSETIHSGDIVAKTVDNLENIFILAKFSKQENNSSFASGERFELRTADFKTTAVVKDCKTGDEKTYAVFQLSDLPPEFAKGRKVQFTLIRSSYRGVVLPKQALIEKNNTFGVYVIKTQQVYWKEVKLVGAIDEQVVVSGLIPTDIIIVNPKWVKEDDLLNI